MDTRFSKRRRLNNITPVEDSAPAAPKAFPNDPSTAASEVDKKKWKGWCEIESDPALFNVMLKRFGVVGVKVQEVFSLDDAMLDFLPRPVYGLVFLFKWREDDPDKQEESCPPDVWFANQTVSNACASVALLNIINNCQEIDLGKHLQSFKEFTADFTPALRGDAVGNFEFVKQIHNSFARKMDMLNADLAMKNDVMKSQRCQKRKVKETEESEAAHHFIAFVPVDGTLWKLDGLERQPRNLGNISSGDWIGQVKLDIEALMAEYEDGQLDFAILSLVKDPLIRLTEELASNVKAIQALSARLDEIEPDWHSIAAAMSDGSDPSTDGTLIGPSLDYALKAEGISDAILSTELEQRLSAGTAADLIRSRQGFVTFQLQLRTSIKEEQESNSKDEVRAIERRHDYGPAVQAWLRFHARSLTIKMMLDAG